MFNFPKYSVALNLKGWVLWYIPHSLFNDIQSEICLLTEVNKISRNYHNLKIIYQSFILLLLSLLSVWPVCQHSCRLQFSSLCHATVVKVNVHLGLKPSIMEALE